MFEKFTTFVKTNKNEIIRKSLIVGGSVAGVIAAGVLISKIEPVDDGVEIVTHEDGSFTVKEATKED